MRSFNTTDRFNMAVDSRLSGTLNDLSEWVSGGKACTKVHCDVRRVFSSCGTSVNPQGTG